MVDYVIVGGGIYGCTVAWELAKRGADVRLLEAKTIASGASGGLGERGVRANGRDGRELPLMRLAYDIWPTLHKEINGFTGYRRLGHLDMIEREEDLVTSAGASLAAESAWHRVPSAGRSRVARVGTKPQRKCDSGDLLPERRRGRSQRNHAVDGERGSSAGRIRTGERAGDWHDSARRARRESQRGN